MSGTGHCLLTVGGWAVCSLRRCFDSEASVRVTPSLKVVDC